MNYLPKGVWDPEGEGYSAFLYLYFGHFHIENLLTSYPSHSVAAVEPETNDSGEQGVLVTLQAAVDLVEVLIQESVSLLEVVAQEMV